MRSRRWWLLTAVIAMVTFGFGLLTSGYVDYQKPHFVAEVARVEAYAVGAGDDQDLRLFASLGEGDRLDVPVVTEEPDRVIVKLPSFRFVPQRDGFKNLAAYLVQTRAILRQPLGTRTVVDATTGRIVPRSAPQP